MSKRNGTPPRNQKGKPFIAGVIAGGLTCALYSVIFPFYRIGDYVIGLAVSALAGWVVNVMAKGLDTSQEAPAQRPIPQTGDHAADALIANGQEMLRAIRHENDLIPDEALSRKMDELDDVADRIFRAVAEQPQKAPQIRRFMDYYLPTTLKMLTGYRKMDERQLSGASAQATRRQIEDAMDIVLTAFRRQLETLYQNDMLDISTDIDVLETMLRQDGLLDTGLHTSSAAGSGASSGAQAAAQAQQQK